MSKAKKIYITLGILAGIILFGTLFYVVARMIAPQEDSGVHLTPMEKCGEETCVEGYVPRGIERGMSVEQVRQIVGEHGECRQGDVSGHWSFMGGVRDRSSMEEAMAATEDVPFEGVCIFRETVSGDCYTASYDYHLYLRDGRVRDYYERVGDGFC